MQCRSRPVWYAATKGHSIDPSTHGSEPMAQRSTVVGIAPGGFGGIWYTWKIIRSGRPTRPRTRRLSARRVGRRGDQPLPDRLLEFYPIAAIACFTFS